VGFGGDCVLGGVGLWLVRNWNLWLVVVCCGICRWGFAVGWRWGGDDLVEYSGRCGGTDSSGLWLLVGRVVLFFCGRRGLNCFIDSVGGWVLSGCGGGGGGVWCRAAT